MTIGNGVVWQKFIQEVKDMAKSGGVIGTVAVVQGAFSMVENLLKDNIEMQGQIDKLTQQVDELLQMQK